LLCSHIYLTVKRKIRDNVQIVEMKEERIRLFSDRITTASDQFLIEEVLDMSYKSFSNKNGFLYLHTSRGVFAFMTAQQPNELLDYYRFLKHS
jgi:hypothetical protein